METINTIINIKPEIVFYHIEKCMGTSIEDMLYEYFKNYYAEKDIYKPYKNQYRHFCLEEKIYFEKNNFKVILSHMSFNEKNLTSSFCKSALSIVCVRNPIHRIISHYYHFDYKLNNCKHLHNFSNNEIKQYLLTRKTVLARLSGNTMSLKIAKENLKMINCILITEKYNDEKQLFEDYLNKKLNGNYNLSTVKNNKTNYSSLNCNIDKDILMILKYSDILSDELELYYHILNMDVKDRFK